MIDLLNMTFVERLKITMGELQESKEWGGGWSMNERLHALMSCLFDLGVCDRINLSHFLEC